MTYKNIIFSSMVYVLLSGAAYASDYTSIDRSKGPGSMEEGDSVSFDTYNKLKTVNEEQDKIIKEKETVINDLEKKNKEKITEIDKHKENYEKILLSNRTKDQKIFEKSLIIEEQTKTINKNNLTINDLNQKFNEFQKILNNLLKLNSNMESTNDENTVKINKLQSELKEKNDVIAEYKKYSDVLKDDLTEKNKFLELIKQQLLEDDE